MQIIPRNERFVEETLSCTLNGNESKLINVSESGIYVRFEQPSKEDEEFEVEVYCKDQPLFKETAKVIRIAGTENGYEAGLEFKNPMQNGRIHTGIQLSKINCECAKQITDIRGVTAEFQLLVMELKELLSNYKKQLESLEETHVIEDVSQRRSLFDSFQDIFLPEARATIMDYMVRVHNMVTAYSPEQYGKCKDLFRRELKTLLDASCFVSRSNKKPLGYAGDYLMMLQIYGDELQGKTLFEKLIFNWSVNVAAPKSVRNRRTYFCERLSQLDPTKKHHVISLACGPAVELGDFLNKLDPQYSANFTFSLLDQDHGALLHAKKNTNAVVKSRSLKCSVNYLPLTIGNILRGDESYNNLEKADFIYSAGLFDYLSNDVAKMLIAKLYQGLTEDGKIIIGNFNHGYPQAISDFTGDWSLICRDDNEMKNLVTVKAKRVLVDHDDEGIETFLEIDK